jgi:hypothetical protein
MGGKGIEKLLSALVCIFLFSIIEKSQETKKGIFLIFLPLFYAKVFERIFIQFL